MPHQARYPDQVETADLHWLAGLLEGEGSFMAGPPSSSGSPIVCVTMTDRDVIDRAGAVLGAKAVAIRPRARNWRPSFSLTLRGPRAVAWMAALRPLLGQRRQAQIDAALASYVPSKRRLTREQVWQILDLLSAGHTVADVAARMNVTPWCVYDIRLGRTHRPWSEQWHSRTRTQCLSPAARGA